MALTTKDIARLAGVSQSTVSRSLNNSPLISDETRGRVLRIAEELGFELNANARGLSTNRTNTIGVIYPDDYLDHDVSLYLGSLLTQLRKILEQWDLDLIVAFKENRKTGVDSIKRLVMRKKVDALIIVQSHTDERTLEFLKKTNIPCVLLHFYQSSKATEGIDQVYADHVAGGYLGCEHLIKLGHRRILCVSAEGEEEYEQRRCGYRAALERYGIAYDPALMLNGDRTFQSGYDLVMDHEALFDSVTAVFVHTDIMALGVMEALKARGRRIPEDIAVVGYDDVELSAYFQPHLTTVHQPREELAAVACQHLMELLSSKRTVRGEQIKIQPSLVVRQSCGAHLVSTMVHDTDL
ncbi:MAG TPA: LacI family DNA-binding transcriptional regulator [Sphaerochaeta sp.]|jgi:LacI family transcriptional regulator|nr:LacI family DNA-binding transcriptional regulator [Spirochaetota bacterium]NLV60958.1 LacI family transcriptional regulator [Spirochaetales bacterium]HOE84768.1 LacI family DNA-binding transcriptional regulator [Sphaerochaeta sp.]HOQ94925.1 LacI family DNA-binding transcriptional regulator [Sphaerochaeta sp.]HPK47613.1 LacI family DNA-binding transcriptional regulator [Sphaerochaeta sp.]